jgi:hypothetical protein
MNIFYFDEDPGVAAQAQPDKLLVKMPLETAQMLCTAHRELDGDEYADEVGLYKRAYWNHPCTIWARETSENYWWLYRHFIELGKEYTYRYQKTHASLFKLAEPLHKVPDNITQGAMTCLPQAMPDEYKNKNPITAYRAYCINEKYYARWEKGRAKPTWWEEPCHL